jgi:hypothetical protein
MDYVAQLRAAGRAISVCVPLVLGFNSASAQAATLQAMFERHGLIGTWAFDCRQPASEQNPYVVYRVVDPEHVARETQNSATSRLTAGVADLLVESNPNEVVIVIKTERGRTNLTVRFERKRMRTFQSTRDSGEKVIVNGWFTARDIETLWYSKCSAEAGPTR